MFVSYDRNDHKGALTSQTKCDQSVQGQMHSPAKPTSPPITPPTIAPTLTSAGWRMQVKEALMTPERCRTAGALRMPPLQMQLSLTPIP